jgi:hypothetical protein
MIAGLPGTGSGGFFYLLTALWMPFRETGRALRGQSSGERWSVIGLQGAIALGVIASAWTTGWLLALAIPPSWLNHRVGNNLLRIAPIILQAATLSLVFVGVHTLRLLTRPRSRPRSISPLAVERGCQYRRFGPGGLSAADSARQDTNSGGVLWATPPRPADLDRQTTGRHLVRVVADRG